MTPHSTGSDASVTEAMVEAALSAWMAWWEAGNRDDNTSPMRAALTAALSLPTPKGNNDERLPCDVFVPPALIIRKGVKYSTLFEALSHRVGKNTAPIDASAIRGAS